MTRSTPRTARIRHRCETRNVYAGCVGTIEPGQRYLEHVCSPNHDGLGNPGWWKIAECAPCAQSRGRIDLLLTLDLAGHDLVRAGLADG